MWLGRSGRAGGRAGEASCEGVLACGDVGSFFFRVWRVFRVWFIRKCRFTSLLRGALATGERGLFCV